jgi:hypothetical protein
VNGYKVNHIENISQEGYDWILDADSDINVKCSADECPYEENCKRKTMQSVANTEWDDLSYKCNIDIGFNSYIEDTNIIIKNKIKN